MTTIENMQKNEPHLVEDFSCRYAMFLRRAYYTKISFFYPPRIDSVKIYLDERQYVDVYVTETTAR